MLSSCCLLPRGCEFMFTSGKKGRGDAFPSDVVCAEQMHGPLSLWELRSRKSDHKEFGLQFRVLSETAVKSDLDLFFGSCDTVVESCGGFEACGKARFHGPLPSFAREERMLR